MVIQIHGGIAAGSIAPHGAGSNIRESVSIQIRKRNLNDVRRSRGQS
jgi:hypothetical protein